MSKDYSKRVTFNRVQSGKSLKTTEQLKKCVENDDYMKHGVNMLADYLADYLIRQKYQRN
jgi:hypothetical protein